MWIILVEFQIEDDFFASIEILVHLLNALTDADLVNEIIQLLEFIWLKSN